MFQAMTHKLKTLGCAIGFVAALALPAAQRLLAACTLSGACASTRSNSLAAL